MGNTAGDFCIEFLEKKQSSGMKIIRICWKQLKIMIEKNIPVASKPNELLTILSVADDLDAFGFSGIFRYSEIYLIRGYQT